MARSRVLEPSPIALIGGVLAIISCFLAWDGYNDSFDVPLRFLWDKDDLAGAAGILALLAPSGLWPFRRRRSTTVGTGDGASAASAR
jgi:hypothetical protein